MCFLFLLASEELFGWVDGTELSEVELGAAGELGLLMASAAGWLECGCMNKQTNLFCCCKD